MSDKFDDGGPAFPSRKSSSLIRSDGKIASTLTEEGPIGMSLRDWFAGMALQGLVQLACNPNIRNLNKSITDYAVEAYQMADAMLDVRSKTAPE